MRILYIGRFQLPNKDAASLRVYNIGYVIKQCRHQVDYLCLENHSGDPITWEGSQYHFVFSKEASGIEKNREWLFGKGTVKRLNELCHAQRYDAVILYNTTSFIEKKIFQYCHHEKIRVLCDVTEWYEVRFPKNINDLLSTLHAWAVSRRIEKVDCRIDGVIAISKFLYDYYTHMGLKVIRIPPVFNYPREFKDPDGKQKTIIYAGRPAKKDEIQILMDAVKAVNQDGIVVRMIFIGTTNPENCEIYEKNGIYFKPRCDNSQVIKYVRSSDFTVLFRRNKRFAKAGYSTKVAESLYNGVPVLCNEIGGTDTDIENGRNGIKIKALTLNDVSDALMQIARMSQEECITIRKNCREIGDQLFNADNYAERINAFLRKVFD